MTTATKKRESKFLRVEEVQEILECSRSFAYETMAKLNRELEAKGIITMKGKVSKKYFMERIYG